MRIIHIAYSCVPGRFRGGIAKAVWELSVAQAVKGHTVDVFTTTSNSGTRTDIAPGSVTEHSGVRIHYFDACPRLGYISRGLRQQLEREVGRADIVHGHNTFLALNRYAARIAALAVPTFFHVHGALDPLVVARGPVRRAKKEVYIRAIERRNLSAASGIFALTNHEKAQLVDRHISAPIHVIENGVVPLVKSREEALKWYQQFAVPQDRRILTYLGRIVPKKALHVLIDAFARIHLQYPNWRLVIAGDRSQEPSYTATLDRLVESAHLSNEVVWVGYVDEHAKRGLLSVTDLFSHVTESEGMALAPLEAMAAGIPTIVSEGCYMGSAARAGAVREVACDAEALAVTLRSLAESPAELSQLGVSGARYVEEHHSWPRIAERILGIYELAGS